MTNFNQNCSTAKLQCETSRLAHIAAVNRVKWVAFYQWQSKNQPNTFTFKSTEPDQSIVCEAAAQLMQQYPGVFFVPVFK